MQISNQEQPLQGTVRQSKSLANPLRHQVVVVLLLRPVTPQPYELRVP
jgi:hypothetical protein